MRHAIRPNAPRAEAPAPEAVSGYEGLRQSRRLAGAEALFRATQGRNGTAPLARVESERHAVGRTLQRRATPTRSGPPGGSIDLGSGGSPLPEGVRQRMEPRLGANLGQVRVHADGQAAEAAQSVQARAFTVGNDVHFNQGEFAPGTKEGDRLLAHELTHVVQGQGAGVQRKAQDDGEEKDELEVSDPDELEVSDPDEPAEKEADQRGDEIAADLHEDEKQKPEPIQPEEKPKLGRKPLYRAEDPQAKPVDKWSKRVDAILADEELGDVRNHEEVKDALAEREVVAKAKGAGKLPAAGTPAPAPDPAEASDTGICADPAPFVGAVKEIKTRWDELKTDGNRAAEVGKAATQALSIAQIKTPVGGVSQDIGSLAEFGAEAWQIAVQKPLLDRPSAPADEEMKELADVSFHETRHAEQYFRRARLQAEQKLEQHKGDRSLAEKEVKLPDVKLPDAVLKDALDAAAGKKLDDKDKAEAQNWEDSMTQLAEPYLTVLNGMDVVKPKIKRVGEIKKWLETKPDATPEVMAKVDKLFADLVALHNEIRDIYAAFPEEADAWRAGAKAKASYP